MCIALQPGIIYGPIFSRRLGRSLGINILPVTKKVCSFDCVYCEYGRTTEHTLLPAGNDLPDLDEILTAVAHALKKPRTIEYLTFSGNGEPTLHPDFPDIVRGVRELLKRKRPESKLAIFSNASRLCAKEVAEAILIIDKPMLKLDAGSQEMFEGINRPVSDLHFDDILVGLQKIPHAIIQSILIEGEISNLNEDAYEEWAGVLNRLRPHKIHIYSIERPTAESGVRYVSPEKLRQIQYDLKNRFNLDVDAF